MAETIDLEGLGRCEVPPGVDVAKLARGWAYTLEGVRKAFEGLTAGLAQAARVATHALQREQRRMRRRAARRGTRGRRGARSVGPWGVAWPMLRPWNPITLDEAADLEGGAP